MDPASLTLGVVAVVIQGYDAVTEIYNTYLDYKSFDQDYHDIRMCLMIEKCRLDLWATKMQLSHQRDLENPSDRDLLQWKLFKMVFDSMLIDLKKCHEQLESLGERTGSATQGDVADFELVDNLAAARVTENKTRIKPGPLSRLKYVLRDKPKLKTLMQKLCYLNDSLEKMSGQLERESLHRSLKISIATKSVDEMPQVRDAAALLEHKEIQQLAVARLVVQNSDDMAQETHVDSETPTEASQKSFCMDGEDIAFASQQIATNHQRVVAHVKGEDVVIDWRASEDDAWRKNNPKAFQKRTENLTLLLNEDLQPENVAIMPCVGYISESKHRTGYAFRIPDFAKRTKRHHTLFDLIAQEQKRQDLPDLGDRFKLAQALVNTVFEIHSINWMHKNISSRNIIFWDDDINQDGPSVRKPFMMGFDVSRPNQPHEVSEQVLQRIDDDHYRHPDYIEHSKHASAGLDLKRRSFQPSYDLYSLGVVLYEIGLWRNISFATRTHPDRHGITTINTDPKMSEKWLEEKQLKKLRGFTSRRYSEIVVACLDRSADRFWSDQSSVGQSTWLRKYLRHIESNIVGPLATLNA